MTALSRDISDSLDEALRTERLEKFQDAVANVVSDLANVGFDFIFDSLTDSTDRAAEAIEEYTYEVDGAQRAVDLLVSDITRLNRLQEDTALGGERLREDRARAVRNLQRRLRETAASQPVGDQRGIQRNIERQQDIRARLRERREDFDVRIGRFDQDAALRQSRLIEDAVSNRDRAEAGPGQEGFLEQLLAGLANTISSSLSDLIGNAVAGALAGALTNPFSNLIEAIKRLFGGSGGDGTTIAPPDPMTPSLPTTDSTPMLTAPTESLAVLTDSTVALTAPAESLSVLTHSTPTLTAPLMPLAVLTTPTLTAPLTSLEVLTHCKPTIGTIPAVSIPSESITPVVATITEAIDIPAKSVDLL